MRRRTGGLGMLVLMLALLTGCLFRPVEDLYRLPERFPGYESLENEIAKVREELRVLGPSVEYAPIFSGENTATIQLHDLDGDGERESALAFFRVPNAEMGIKIYVFLQDEQGDYTIQGVIEGEGTGIYCLDIADINGLGLKEIVVSWQTSRGVYQLGVYSLDEHLRDRQPAADAALSNTWSNPALQADEILRKGYKGSTGYALVDINRDGRIEVAVAHVDTAGTNSYLEFYACKGEASEMESLGTVSLSNGISSLDKMRSNYITNYLPALYLTSTLTDGGRATDVVSYRSGTFLNLSLDPDTGVSHHVLREYGSVGPIDINGDNILELPWPISLPGKTDAAVSFYLLDWTQYDGQGNALPAFATYYTDEWYFEIPDAWRDKITIHRIDNIGERTVVFARWYGENTEPEDFLAIHQLTGPNRFTRAALYSRFQLEDDSSTIYAASFFEGSWDCGLTQADVISRFHRVISSWSEG